MERGDSNDVRIGVYVCHCGSNIAGTVDVERVSLLVADEPGVLVSRNDKFMCSDPGQELIRRDIREHGLTRVVVAACSPQMHELTFRRACEEEGLNRYLFQMANIREQCSWVHPAGDEATEKALALTRAAIRRVAHHEPLQPIRTRVNPAVLVIGAGIAGIQASLDIADAGRPVYLVERDSTIGGTMARLDKTFPTLDCASCILTPRMTSVAHRANITLLTLTEVRALQGAIGDFRVTLLRKARYVTDQCTACGDCVKVCPVHVPDPFNENRSTRTAIHRAFPQAVPRTYVIDKQERPPCTEACPIRQEAAGYIALIRDGRFQEAGRLIRTRNPLAFVCGRICYHPCETECNRGYVDRPLAIQQLKRFALDWELDHIGHFDPPAPRHTRSQKIAVIGSGPAGLTCAHDLALEGYRVAVFEQLPVLGGMLSVAIPEFRLPKRLLAMELDAMKAMGIEFHTDTHLGTHFTIESLIGQSYDAVFVAIGAHRSVKLEIPGEDLDGVIQGVDFLRRVNLGLTTRVGRHVGVVGGGNTALDAARCALRLGAEKVTVLYRRTRSEMAASAQEIEDAEAEGVHFAFLTSPVEVMESHGKAAGLVCMRMQLGEPDALGRRRPTPVPQSEYDLLFDLVIPAISQAPELSALDQKGPYRLALTHEGTISVNRETLQTSVPCVFAGGDAILGPATVIEAMGAGRRAAESIDKYLRGEPLQGYTTHLVRHALRRGEDFRPHAYAPTYRETGKAPRVETRRLDPLQRRHSLEEVEETFTEAEAVREASRCLNCGVCVECLECERVCQVGAVDHSMKDETLEVEVGQILVTTGFDLMDPRRIGEYGYGRFRDVYTSLEFERMLSATGPTGGKILTRAGEPPRSIGIIHCVGSRDTNYHPYCSRVCCSYALKFGQLARERCVGEVTQFYIDIRSSGKGQEEFYCKTLESGVNVIRGKVAEVVEAAEPDAAPGSLVVRVEDTLLGRYREIAVDMVVLCPALEPRHDAAQLAKILGIRQGADGFYMERHPKLEPVSTMTDGIYVAGCAQGPKDITDTVAQASAAASRILGISAREEIETEALRAAVDPAACGACMVCLSMCPYGAISFDRQQGSALVNQVLCKGCGTCVAACPAGAIAGSGFSDRQLVAELEGLLAESE
jgi:heterodisulfide reductase subunit A